MVTLVGSSSPPTGVSLFSTGVVTEVAPGGTWVLSFWAVIAGSPTFTVTVVVVQVAWFGLARHTW